jgi:hypothetical protein
MMWKVIHYSLIFYVGYYLFDVHVYGKKYKNIIATNGTQQQYFAIFYSVMTIKTFIRVWAVYICSNIQLYVVVFRLRGLMDVNAKVAVTCRQGATKPDNRPIIPMLYVKKFSGSVILREWYNCPSVTHVCIYATSVWFRFKFTKMNLDIGNRS